MENVFIRTVGDCSSFYARIWIFFVFRQRNSSWRNLARKLKFGGDISIRITSFYSRGGGGWRSRKRNSVKIEGECEEKRSRYFVGPRCVSTHVFVRLEYVSFENYVLADKTFLLVYVFIGSIFLKSPFSGNWTAGNGYPFFIIALAPARPSRRDGARRTGVAQHKALFVFVSVFFLFFIKHSNVSRVFVLYFRIFWFPVRLEADKWRLCRPVIDGGWPDDHLTYTITSGYRFR